MPRKVGTVPESYYSGCLAEPSDCKELYYDNTLVYYAITVKCLKVGLRNSQVDLDMMLLLLKKKGIHILYKKYELDSQHNALHVHGVFIMERPLKSYYPFRWDGWTIYFDRLKEDYDLWRWLNYLTKGDPNSQILILNMALSEYMFVDRKIDQTATELDYRK